MCIEVISVIFHKTSMIVRIALFAMTVRIVVIVSFVLIYGERLIVSIINSSHQRNIKRRKKSFLCRTIYQSYRNDFVKCFFKFHIVQFMG
jgi:cell division protein FtsB